jgi:hypothetical protein
MISAGIMLMSVLAMSSFLTKADDGTTGTMNYDDVSLSGGFQANHFKDIWDLTAVEKMTLTFTYDAGGLVDDAGAHAWAEFGVRTCGYEDFNPTWSAEGAGVWLATDYDWTANTFDPDPPGAPTLDLDDKLILQKGGGNGEGGYNLPSAPPVPDNNHRIWWDRDGVDPWQNPATANTGGIYQIVITLQATSPTAGTAYMNIRMLDQGFETDGNWNTIELTPAGMSWTGDMKHLQVFYGLYGYGATHSVSFTSISVFGNHDTYDLEFDASSASIVLTGESAMMKVRVTDSSDDPEPGVLVNFAGSAGLVFSSATATTDDDGYAVVTVSSATSGVYTITANVCHTYFADWMLVVCDPGGMTAGGGWYYVEDAIENPMLGTAHFGFIAKYLKGSPQGNLEFQYQSGDVNLKSTKITYLAVSKTVAVFKGVASLNGVDGFYFKVMAKDFAEPGVGVDEFNIWIWDGNPDLPTTTLTHHSSNVLAGGNIMIKTK